jgi:hypothetical protein
MTDVLREALRIFFSDPDHRTMFLNVAEKNMAAGRLPQVPIGELREELRNELGERKPGW